uniref:collagen binding domain-containing protein n=1 Tax=Staphylococcus haemolyticus TaxID=1283 RepID=UPI0034D5845A
MKKEKKIFSIRKFTMGVGSVVIGSAMFLGFEAHEAYADEIPSEQNQPYSIHNENSTEENNATPESNSTEENNATLESNSTEENNATPESNSTEENNATPESNSTEENNATLESNAQNSPTFITDSDFTIENINDKGEAPIWSSQKIRYEWDATGYSKGDEITFTLPEQFKLSNNVNFDLVTSDEIVLGKVIAEKNGNVLVQLTDENDYLSTHENTKGWMDFETTFNRDVVKEGETYDIKIGTKGYSFKIEDHVVDRQPLNKWGYVDENNKVSWTVRVNLDNQLISNAKLTDELGEGLTFDEDSLSIRNYDSDQEKIGSPFNDYRLEPTTNGFIIDFLNDINSAYDITYTTTPSNGINRAYTNSVELTGDGYEYTLNDRSSEFSRGNGAGDGDVIPEQPE